MICLLGIGGSRFGFAADDRTPGQDAIEPVAGTTAPPVAQGGTSDVQTRITEVQKALDDLREDKSADTTRIQGLENRLQLLRQIQDGRTRTRSLRAQGEAAPSRRSDLEKRLAAARAGGTPSQVSDDVGESEVRERVRTLSQSIDDAEAQNQFVVSSLDFRLRRRQELREIEARNLSDLAAIDGETGVSTIDRKLQLEQLQVEQELIEAERSMFRATDPNLILSRKVLDLETDALRNELSVWQNALNDRIRQSARELAANADQAVADAASTEIRTQAEQNRDLAGQLEAIHLDSGATDQRVTALRQQLERIRRQRMLDESRVVRKPTSESVSQMRARFASFPDITQINADIASERRLIQTARDQLDFLETLSWLPVPTTAENTIDDGESVDDEKLAARRAQLEEVFRVRQDELVAPLRASLNDRIDALSHLVTLQESLLTEIKRYKQQVLDRTIWIRDPTATTAANFALARKQLRESFSPSAWSEVFGLLTARGGDRPVLVAFGVVPLILWLALRRPVRRRIRLAGERVSDPRTDGIRETMVVTLMALFAAVAWAAPAFVLSVLLVGRYDSTPLVLSLHGPVVGLWQALFVAGLLWSMLGPDGLAERHFLYTRATVRRARLALLVGLTVVPFVLLASVCRPDGLDCIPAGRLIFTPVPVLLAVTAWLLLRPPSEARSGEPTSHAPRWLLLWSVIACLVVIGVAANVGWYRLVMSFQRGLIESLLLVLGVLLAREFLLRFLRARHWYAASDLRDQADRGEDVSDEARELALLETRTLRAIRFGVFAGILLGLYWIWRTVFPAFAGLDQVVVWAAAGGGLPGSDLAVTESRLIITLGDLTRCFVALVVSWYTARNLPALIELVVIDRFRLERGINYAITQLLQWLLLIGGLAYSASFLDISWTSVQWLAAGLTVGLGFGLQEIFANFISGLIILFERPIRLGDVVTVGGTNGRVSRIRMRSTTITDWDRKELVVPNKKFVTEEIVNWSIGDACIRLVLPVGVSYAEDPEAVVAILHRICSTDPEILEDPAPRVIFQSFGDSSLDFELRIYLPSTENMSMVRTRLNTEIKRAFDDAGITIPFPQRDIRVEMVRPDDPESGPAMPLPGPDAVEQAPDGDPD